MSRTNTSHAIVLLGLTVTALFYKPSLNQASAKECKNANFDTPYRKFMSDGGIGKIAFAFQRNPVAVESVNSGTCYEVPKRFRNKRLFLFLNHRSNDTEKQTSFLAAQIVKNYKTLRFTEEKVTAVRMGSWQRVSAKKPVKLPEIRNMKPFDAISPQRFGTLHAETPFSEEQLVKAFDGQFWHGTPNDGGVSSLDRLSYWSSTNVDDEKTKVENYLIRFTTVKRGDKPKSDKYGISISTYFHSNLSTLRVQVRSPADGGIQESFLLK